MESRLIGPFEEIVTCHGLPESGPIDDEALIIIKGGGIAVRDGRIDAIGSFKEMHPSYTHIETVKSPSVAIPALIDAHTHICFAGNRASDYAKRLSGKSYLEIAESGGGILDTVKKTREASKEELVNLMLIRLNKMLQEGVGTAEVKSGYGLNKATEWRMLEAIELARTLQPIDLIATCLGAHTLPPEFPNELEYLAYLEKELLQPVWEANLAKRIDIFVEKGAFSKEGAFAFLKKAKEMGFDLVVHGDQFTPEGAQLAAAVGALSCDHLEVTSTEGFELLKTAGVIPIMLPGASLGLGLPFPPARKALDMGLPLAIASDWNPGSAPFGYLLAEAAFLSAAQKLTMAETLAGITVRAARALNCRDRGALKPNLKADILAFPCRDYREILYWQGGMKPHSIWIEGNYVPLFG